MEPADSKKNQVSAWILLTLLLHKNYTTDKIKNRRRAQRNYTSTHSPCNVIAHAAHAQVQSTNLSAKMTHSLPTRKPTPPKITQESLTPISGACWHTITALTIKHHS